MPIGVTRLPRPEMSLSFGVSSVSPDEYYLARNTTTYLKRSDYSQPSYLHGPFPNDTVWD